MSGNGGMGKKGGHLCRLPGTISLIGLLCTAPLAGPLAAVAQADLFSDLTPMTPAELARERGGFNISGFDISVGVSVETVVDGFVTVSTRFSVADAGRLTHLGTEVRTYGSPGSHMPDVAAIVQQATPDVGAIMDRVFGAADAGIGDDGRVDRQAVAGGATTAAVLGAADTLVKVTETLAPDTAGKSNPPIPGSPAAAPEAVTPTVAVTSRPFDGAALASDGPATAIKTGPKATPSATVAAPAAVAASSHPVVATTQVSIGHPEAAKASPNGHIQLAELAGAATPGGGQASILHQVGNGQLSIIENSMNNVTVRQSTRINLTVENFIRTQDMMRLQKSLETTARLAGIASLRR